MRIASSTGRHLIWRDTVLYNPEYTIVFRLTRGVTADEDVVEVLGDAPATCMVTGELLEEANPRFLAQGDGILTFCPEHPSRVSYRIAGPSDDAPNCWRLERIS